MAACRILISAKSSFLNLQKILSQCFFFSLHQRYVNFLFLVAKLCQNVVVFVFCFVFVKEICFVSLEKLFFSSTFHHN